MGKHIDAIGKKVEEFKQRPEPRGFSEAFHNYVNAHMLDIEFEFAVAKDRIDFLVNTSVERLSKPGGVFEHYTSAINNYVNVQLQVKTEARLLLQRKCMKCATPLVEDPNCEQAIEWRKHIKDDSVWYRCPACNSFIRWDDDQEARAHEVLKQPIETSV